jgi:hypothetical protein
VFANIFPIPIDLEMVYKFKKVKQGSSATVLKPRSEKDCLQCRTMSESLSIWQIALVCA